MRSNSPVSSRNYEVCHETGTCLASPSRRSPIPCCSYCCNTFSMNDEEYAAKKANRAIAVIASDAYQGPVASTDRGGKVMTERFHM